MHAPERPQGEVFLDARGHGRAMRLTWHHEADLVVLSLWREGMCAGTFRLSKTDVNDFIDALVDGLRDAPGVQDPSPGGRRIGEVVQPSQAASATEHSLPPVPEHVAEHAAAAPAPHEHIAYVETGESEYPEFTAPDAEPSFLDWAFGSEGRANAS